MHLSSHPSRMHLPPPPPQRTTDDSCVGSVAKATFGAPLVTRSATFSNFGPGKLIYRITQLGGYNTSNAGGLQV